MTLSYFGRTEIPPRRWLLWPFVVKLRERESSAMMAFEAAERGWGCILGNKFIGRRQDLPRGIVIEKLIAPGTASKISHMLEIGKRVSACCEEGLVYPNAQEYGRRKIERGSYDQLERFFAWGHIQANDLTERINLDGSKITISGNPRFDLHRPELRGAFDESVAAIRRRYGPFILINTRFSMFNSFRGDEAVVNKTQTLGKTAEGKTRDHIAFQGKIYSAFMDLVEALHDRLPELQIIIRPHPSERHDPWHAKATEHARVHTISRCNVIPWILASEAVIHTNCTTGVEAYLLGKPAIAFRPICDPQFDMVLPNALSS